MLLDEEIRKARLQIHTDAYPMSIGELVSLYEDGDLDIHPEFQRVFRWNKTQQSRLIESIFLGIPLPSIFVSQREDGVWDVVDGLQRISTILSFMGKLQTAEGGENSLKTEQTHYLPSLADKSWDDIGADLQRLFKREKIDIKIIKRESEADAKFELFQRLNTGGSRLSAQEVRNCLLLMINPKAFTYIQTLSGEANFLDVMPISEKRSEEAFHQEYVIRYFIQQNHNIELRAAHSDIGPYFDAETIRIFDPKSGFDYRQEEVIFKQTFHTINGALGEDAFKKFSSDDNKYKGPVSTAIFEILTTAVAAHLKQGGKLSAEAIQQASQKASKEIAEISSNTRPIVKMNLALDIARSLFTHDQN